jgi:hypothetical protein
MIRIVKLKPVRPDAEQKLRDFQQRAFSESLKAHNQYRQMCLKSSFKNRDLVRLQETINSRRLK